MPRAMVSSGVGSWSSTWTQLTTTWSPVRSPASAPGRRQGFPDFLVLGVAEHPDVLGAEMSGEIFARQLQPFEFFRCGSPEQSLGQGIHGFLPPR
ncbi:hypothetical protein [Streptomyces benahoarensis]|uniref:hypothetical protein n=1 Tax=Streptomyces benahoarensis TaxID=2595054 RepID=UPI0020358805|nr:hypothetical protein [Streptomyces benahoarensis]